LAHKAQELQKHVQKPTADNLRNLFFEANVLVIGRAADNIEPRVHSLTCMRFKTLNASTEMRSVLDSRGVFTSIPAWRFASGLTPKERGNT